MCMHAGDIIHSFCNIGNIKFKCTMKSIQGFDYLTFVSLMIDNLCGCDLSVRGGVHEGPVRCIQQNLYLSDEGENHARRPESMGLSLHYS